MNLQAWETLLSIPSTPLTTSYTPIATVQLYNTLQYQIQLTNDGLQLDIIEVSFGYGIVSVGTPIVVPFLDFVGPNGGIDAAASYIADLPDKRPDWMKIRAKTGSGSGSIIGAIYRQVKSRGVQIPGRAQ